MIENIKQSIEKYNIIGECRVLIGLFAFFSHVSLPGSVGGAPLEADDLVPSTSVYLVT